MLLRLGFALMLVFIVNACIGIDTDKISDELEYRPVLSVPVGQLHVHYDEVIDLPLDLPDPIDSKPVSWQQSEIIYFDAEASLSERKYILSMLLQFDISNEYPAAVEVEIYLAGSLGATTLLTTEPIRLEAAEIDESGAVVKAKSTNPYPYQLPLTDEQIDALLEAEQLVISSKVDALVLSSEVVNSFSTYQLNAAVGVQAQIDFSINNN